MIHGPISAASAAVSPHPAAAHNFFSRYPTARSEINADSATAARVLPAADPAKYPYVDTVAERKTAFDAEDLVRERIPGKRLKACRRLAVADLRIAPIAYGHRHSDGHGNLGVVPLQPRAELYRLPSERAVFCREREDAWNKHRKIRELPVNKARERDLTAAVSECTVQSDGGEVIAAE